MCLTSRESILAFIILVVIAILLYIRNIKYDRILAVFLFAVSLIQLTEFFYHNGSLSSSTGGRLIFMILWLQVLVLAVGVQIYYQTTLTSLWMILFIVIFMIALFYSVGQRFSVTTGDGHLVWSQDGKTSNILGKGAFLYLAGLFIPLLIILYYSGWKDTGMWIILIAVLLSIFLVRVFYPKLVFSSLWCYSAVGVAFVVWLVGAFYEGQK